MDENNVKQEIRTPIDTMLDMAKEELEQHVASCMQKNSIPPGLMKYALKSILLDITEAQLKSVHDELLSLQQSIVETEQGSGE